jgi:hypothetical protein
MRPNTGCVAGSIEGAGLLADSFPWIPSIVLSWVRRLYRRKIFLGDPVGFGGICGKRVVYGVLDGTKWAPWGGKGRMWDSVGGMEDVGSGVLCPFCLEAPRGGEGDSLLFTLYGLRIYTFRTLS